MTEDTIKTLTTLPIDLLVVDDDLFILALIQDALFGREDFAVTAMSDSMEASNLLQRKHFDLVITDLMMPRVDGLTLACVVTETSPETLVVIITGHPTFDTSLEAIKLGVYDYLPKPFSMDEFFFVLDKSAKRIRLERENRLLAERVLEQDREIARLKVIGNGNSSDRE